MHIEVEVDVQATDSELAALDAAFRHAGFDVRVERTVEARSAGAMPWVVYVVLGAPIATFFTSLASEAAKDAYPPLKRWIKDMWAAREGDGYVAFRDTENTHLALGSKLPEEALDALATVDWSQFSGGGLHWSESRQEWLDPLKTPEAF